MLNIQSIFFSFGTNVTLYQIIQCIEGEDIMIIEFKKTETLL
jgi:hypothetical protein